MAFVFSLLKINRKTDHTVAIFGINRKFPCIANMKKIQEKSSQVKFSISDSVSRDFLFATINKNETRRKCTFTLVSRFMQESHTWAICNGTWVLCNYQGPVIVNFSTFACWIKGCISKFPSSNLHLLGNWDAHVRKTLCFCLQM